MKAKPAEARNITVMQSADKNVVSVLADTARLLNPDLADINVKKQLTLLSRVNNADTYYVKTLASLVVSAVSYNCVECTALIQSKEGLISHIKTNHQQSTSLPANEFTLN